MYVPRNQQAAKKLIPAVCATHIHLHSPSYTCHAPRPRQRRATLGKACATCTCHNPFAVQDSPFVQLGRCALGTNFPQLQSFPKRFFFYLPALVFVVVVSHKVHYGIQAAFSLKKVQFCSRLFNLRNHFFFKFKYIE